MTVEDIALTMTPGIGVKGAVHLLDVFGDARRIFEASETELIHGAGLREEIAKCILRKESFRTAERELKHCVAHGIQAVASTDAEYPPLLREIADYPHVLYVCGDMQVLSTRCVSMVGTRHATAYGQQICIGLVREMAECIPDLCVVSGLAFGIDVACHRAAIASGVKTAAVLPCSLPGAVPSQHAAVARDIVSLGGVLVTELHSQVKQRGTFYLARNRIIAGLSAGTVVVESPCGGGSLVTADFADGYNRAVMAVPGRIGDKTSMGTNLLIRNKKAQLVISGEDIARELMWDFELPDRGHTANAALEFTADENRVLAGFTTQDPVSTDSLKELSGLGTAELSVILLGLEIVGAVRQLPGNRYMKLIRT